MFTKLANKIKDIELFNNKFFIFICLVILMPPQSIQSGITDFTIINTLRFVVFFVTFLKTLSFYLRKKELSLFLVLLALYEIVKGAISYHFNNDIIYTLTSLMDLSSCALCFLAYVHIKENRGNFFYALTLLCKIYIYLEFIYLIIGDGGNISLIKMFDGENHYFGFFLLAFLTTYLNANLHNGKMKAKDYILWLVIVFIIIKTRCATAIVGLFIYLTMYILMPFINNYPIFNIFTYSLINISMFFGLVIFKIQKLFSFIIENILHKSLTFSGRTQCWDVFIEAIKKSPVIGYGSATESLLVSYETKTVQLYAHNLFLRELYRGGIVQLFFYLLILGFLIYVLYKNRGNKLNGYSSIVFFVLLTTMLMEVYAESYVFLIYTIINSSSINVKNTNI